MNGIDENNEKLGNKVSVLVKMEKKIKTEKNNRV